MEDIGIENDSWRWEEQAKYKLKKGDIVRCPIDDIGEGFIEGEIVHVGKHPIVDCEGGYEREDEFLIEVWDYKNHFKGAVPVSRCKLIKKYKRSYVFRNTNEQLELCF